MCFPEDVRETIFKKAHGKCENCGKPLVFENHQEGQSGAWEANHKNPVALGGVDEVLNGEALCLACHKATPTYGKH